MRGVFYKKCAFVMGMVLAVMLFSITCVVAAELFPNGDFSNGTTNPWEIAAGSASIDGVNSPFTNVYANNGKSMVINKPDGSVGVVALSSVSSMTGNVMKINYDFMLSSLAASGELFCVRTESDFAFLICMDGPYDHFILYDGDAGGHIAALQPNTWYNVQLLINTDSWTYSGTITDGNQMTGTWSDRKLIGSKSTLQSLRLDESNPNAGTTTIHYDNFSVMSTGSAVIKGKVLSDAAGNPPIVGATVKTTDGSHTTVTGSDGTYSFAVNPNSAYTIEASAQGFTSVSAPLQAGAGDSVTNHNFILPAITGELFHNGDFSNATISPWEISAGSASIDNVNSPFNNVYPNDGHSMVVNKPAGSTGISASGQFVPVASGVVKLNYDFKLASLSVNWQMFGVASGKFIFNNVWDGPSDHFILWDGDPELHVCALKADTWYNVQEEINLDDWTYNGKITEYGCESISWSTRKLEGTYAPIYQLCLNEAMPSSGANTIHYDNISVRTGYAVIKGRVLSDAAGNPPIEGATVKTSDGSHTTATGSDGTYTLAVNPNSTYTVEASATGCLTRHASIAVGAHGGITSHDFILATVVPKAFVYSDSVNVDGNLSEWSADEYTPLDQIYDYVDDSSYLKADIPEAYYAARWGANGHKLYVAIKVRDTSHMFTEGSSTYGMDAAEIYVHTTGTGDINYATLNQANAQQYVIGIKGSDSSQLWTDMGSGNSLPGNAGFTAAGKVDGQWIYYEAAITPYEVFSLDGVGLIESPLSSGQIIGFDVVVDGCDEYGIYTGAKSANLMIGKWHDYTKFAQHLLVKNGSVGDVKNTEDNVGISCDAVVSAAFSDFFYIETTDRTSGIRVNKVSNGLSAGQAVSVSGNVQTLPSGERYIDAATVIEADGVTNIAPLGMTNKALGGGENGQPGVLGAAGLNNIGLLVKTTGRIVAVDTSSQPAWFVIDDGSGVNVKVLGTVPSNAQYVIVTGICSCEKNNDVISREIIATSVDKAL